MEELQKVIATLAFRSTTDCARYKVNLVSFGWNNDLCFTGSTIIFLLFASVESLPPSNKKDKR
jgi:hypothetical protein